MATACMSLINLSARSWPTSSTGPPAAAARSSCRAFAVGRTQQLVLLIHQLIEANEIGNLPVFVDSPLAVNTTDVFKKHQECYDEEAAKFLSAGDDPFGFKRLRYIRDVADSKALNDLHGPMVIISASGMCEGGRILHHLKNNVENPKNTILLTGFQAPEYPRPQDLGKAARGEHLRRAIPAARGSRSTE